MIEEIKKIEIDQNMIEDQLKSLELKESFKNHPKQKEYKNDLKEELENLLKQKEKFIQKKDFHYSLYEWSKTIVNVCDWLENCLDEYCSKNLELPPTILKKMKPAPQLTNEQYKVYSKGLDEITYNLQESQDFFQASVDGRLKKYHQIEKDIIQVQLDILKKYPEDSPRRMYIENELLQDLEYVNQNMIETPEVMKRREKMLKNHQDFFKVLQYYKEKLKSLGFYDGSLERKYDPKFDHYKDDN
jgi:hypothetical protein